jgi:Flp pilus assembly protein TadG
VNRLQRADRDDRGAAAVEFGLLLPLLMIILGGVIDMGFYFNAQISATHAAREGVRVESITTTPGTGAAAATSAYSAINAPLVGVTPTSCPNAASRAAMSVVAEYDFILLPFGSRQVNGQAVMRCGG